MGNLYIKKIGIYKKNKIIYYMKIKIKEFKNFKDPYILVLGDQEMENRTVSVNVRGNKKMNGLPLEKFLEICDRMVDEHSLDLVESAE